jgi:hypothetical protein
MNYTYDGGGEIKVLGSAKQHASLYFYRKFERSSQKRFGNKEIAYLKSEALKGKLQRIVIQKVYMKNTTKTFYKTVNFYEDALHSLYREDELLTLQEAQEIIGLFMLEVKVQNVRAEEKIELPKKHIAKYANNSVMYSFSSAIKGQLEKVLIVSSPNPKLYLDKLNSMWNEEDLVNENEANQLIWEYEQRIATRIHKSDVRIQSLGQQVNIILGQIYYDKIAAKRGIITPVLVTKIINSNIVEDRLNSLWEIVDLIDLSEAKSLALNYWTTRREQLVDVINQSNGDLP